ncbi:MAG TPA: hypothetical protein VJT73_00515 [Polyangiaceae bacterium]|nr:hypothetical protein [Polyangiaceae bacterium]
MNCIAPVRIDRSTLVLVLLVAGATLEREANAQASSADRALAETLFTDAKKLVQAKKYSEACPKFAESQRLDPAPGTVLNLGLCHESEGKLASAWVELKQAQALARTDGRADRAKLCAEHIAAIEPKLARLTIAIVPEAEMGLEIKLDGSLVGKAGWGTASPVDPGSHLVQASAPGKRSWESRVEVSPGASKQTVSVPKLADEPAVKATSDAAPPTTTARAATAPLTDPSEAPSYGGLPSQRVAALAAGGVGVVALGVGGAFAVMAKSTYNKADCDADNFCRPQGIDDRASAKRKANVATVAVSAGVVALAAGAVLWLTSGAKSADAAKRSNPHQLFVSVEPEVNRGANVSFSGAW